MTINSHIALVWKAGEGRYAVPLAAVVEVVRPVWVTPVPQAPGHVLGMIRFRQTVVPVVDLRPRDGSAPLGFLYANRFMIVRIGDRLVALVVDEVLDVVEYGDADVHSRDAIAATMLPPIVSAVLTLERRLVALLDLSSVVTASDLERVDAAIRTLQASGDGTLTPAPVVDRADEGRS